MDNLLKTAIDRKNLLIVWVLLILQISTSHQLLASIAGGSLPAVGKPSTTKVVLVQFADVKWDSFYNSSTSAWVGYEKKHTLADFAALLTSDDYAYYGTNSDGEEVYGSFRDYFWEMSKHTYRPNVIILNPDAGTGYPQWVTLSGNKTYYDGLGWSEGFDSLVAHTKIAAISQLGLSSGELDATTDIKICYIYAGHHCDGIDFTTDFYNIAVPERNHGARGLPEHELDKLGHIGYYCHEFGHCMGSGHSPIEVWRWDLMRQGHKNGSVHANRPAPLNPKFLYDLGWADVIDIDSYLPATDLVYNTEATAKTPITNVFLQQIKST